MQQDVLKILFQSSSWLRQIVSITGGVTPQSLKSALDTCAMCLLLLKLMP